MPLPKGCPAPTTNEIIDACCEALDISLLDFTKSKKDRAVLARGIFCYLCRELLALRKVAIIEAGPFPEHSTVIWNLASIDRLIRAQDQYTLGMIRDAGRIAADLVNERLPPIDICPGLAGYVGAVDQPKETRHAS